jgi:hypothetical protein
VLAFLPIALFVFVVHDIFVPVAVFVTIFIVDLVAAELVVFLIPKEIISSTCM